MIDLLNYYPFYMLQDNRKADELAQQFLIENLNTATVEKLAEGNHRADVIALIG